MEIKQKFWNYLEIEIKFANVLKTLNFLGLQQSIQKESLFLLLLLFGINTVFFSIPPPQNACYYLYQ